MECVAERASCEATARSIASRRNACLGTSDSRAARSNRSIARRDGRRTATQRSLRSRSARVQDKKVRPRRLVEVMPDDDDPAGGYDAIQYRVVGSRRRYRDTGRFSLRDAAWQGVRRPPPLAGLKG